MRLDLVEHPGEILRRGRPEHAQSVLVFDPELARVVVDESHRAQPQLGISSQLADHQAAAVAPTDDQHVPRSTPALEAAHTPIGEQVDDEPGAEQQHQRKQEEQRDDARRKRHSEAGVGRRGRPGHRVKQRDCAHQDDRRSDGGLDHRFVVALTDERPEPLIAAERREHDQRARNNPRDRGLEQLGVATRERCTREPQPER